jgi:hypothetical protein
MKTTQQYSKEENKIILKPFALSSESLHDWHQQASPVLTDQVPLWGLRFLFDTSWSKISHQLSESWVISKIRLKSAFRFN